MHLELALDPADAARLTRHRAVAAWRAGRARGQAVRLVWHDTPETALAHDGLALIDRAGAWRLERIRPNGVATPPAAAPEPVADPADPAALPGPLLPVAAFEGRALTMPLAGPGPLTLTVLTGTIRAVARAEPACRVTLAGAEGEALGLARAIAADLRLSVPPPFSACALAAAAARLPPPRAPIPILAASMTVAEAFAAVTGHLADLLFHWCAHIALETPNSVHQARVALRRLRSALAVFRRATGCDATRQADAGLKALGQLLGQARDWDVFTGGIGAGIARAFDGDDGVARLLRGAEQRREVAYGAIAAHLAAPAFRLLALDLVGLAAGTAWRDALSPEQSALLAEPLNAFANAILDRRLGRVRDAAPDGLDALAAPDLHDLRLRAKRLRYAGEFFAPLHHAKAARRYLKRLAVLQDRLGTANDAAVTGALIRSLPRSGPRHEAAAGIVRGFAAARAGAARGRLDRAWTKFRRQEPFWD